MTLPASGQLSMSDINTELGNTSTAQITLNDTKVRTLLQRTPDISEIGMNAAYGKEFFYTIQVLVIGGGGAGGAGRRDRSGGAGSGGGGGGFSQYTMRVKKTNFSGSIIVGNGGKPDFSFEAQNGFGGYSSQISISSDAGSLTLTSGGGGGGGGNTRAGGGGGSGTNSAGSGGNGADDRTHGQYNKGGDGTRWPYDNTYYSGGGGGGGDGGDGGYNGGAGGGGSGKSSTTGAQGSDYTGGGGGGGASWGNDSWNFGGRGGSGLVKIMYSASYGVLFRIDTGATTLQDANWITHLAYITDHATRTQESKTIVWVGS